MLIYSGMMYEANHGKQHDKYYHGTELKHLQD